MLDLDFLAEKRAQDLNQSSEEWRKVVWSSEFQELSKNMSDGEVSAFVSSCSAPAEMSAVLKYLMSLKLDVSAFTFLTRESSKAGQNLADWIRAKFTAGQNS